MSEKESASSSAARDYTAPKLTVLGSFSALTSAKPGTKGDSPGNSPPNTRF
jgi:hypothetical protein